MNNVLGPDWAAMLSSGLASVPEEAEETVVDHDSGSTHEYWVLRDGDGTPRPSNVKIGAYDFEIRWDVKLKNLYGRASYRLGWIEISKKQSRDAARDTLLHEIMHLLLANSGVGLAYQLEGIPDADADELITNTLVPRLLAVLRDNPEVTAWLLS